MSEEDLPCVGLCEGDRKEDEVEGQGREEGGVEGSHTQSMREISMKSKHSTSRPVIHSLSSKLYPSIGVL